MSKHGIAIIIGFTIVLVTILVLTIFKPKIQTTKTNMMQFAQSNLVPKGATAYNVYPANNITRFGQNLYVKFILDSECFLLYKDVNKIALTIINCPNTKSTLERVQK